MKMIFYGAVGIWLYSIGWTMNWKGCERKQLWLNLYTFLVFAWRLREISTVMSRNNRWRSRDSNRKPPEYWFGILLLLHFVWWDGCQRFGWTRCFLLQGRRAVDAAGSSKRWYLSTTLDGITSQETVIFMANPRTHEVRTTQKTLNWESSDYILVITNSMELNPS
jgi:hypothetical protein